MEFGFFEVPFSDCAMGMNKGCEEAPAFLSGIFGVDAKKFSIPEKEIGEQQESICQQALLLQKLGEANFYLGGTHDITFPLFSAFAEKRKNPSLMIFDAHADADYGTSVPSHDDFVRALVERKIVRPENVMHVGLRKIWDVEREFLAKSGTRFIMDETVHGSLEKSVELAQSFASGAENLYISFDVDVLSEKIMRATGYHPPGGLSLQEAKAFLSATLPCAKAFDLVEFNPKKISKQEDETLKELFSGFLG